MTKNVIALAYDFDGTLAPGYMQDNSFFPELGVKNPFEEFWPEVKRLAKENDMDEILAYMYLMLREATYKNLSIKKEEFIKRGQGMKFFPGVEGWFANINKYASAKGITLKHYIISSGLREMIAGTSIASEFSRIFASGYMYNKDNVAIWPAVAVNYTNKTQYLFRINKGIENSWDNESLNKYWGANVRPVPQENIIYFGDGETDVPAMKMTKYLGGCAIAVYNPGKNNSKESSDALIDQERADFSLEADYSEGKEIDKLVKIIIDRRAEGTKAS